LEKLQAEWFEIVHEEGWPYLDEGGQPLRKLDGFGKVNIFVGPNNGGKSRLLRRIARQTSSAFGVAQDDLKSLKEWLRTKHDELAPHWTSHDGLIAVGAIEGTTLVSGHQEPRIFGEVHR